MAIRQIFRGITDPAKDLFDKLRGPQPAPQFVPPTQQGQQQPTQPEQPNIPSPPGSVVTDAETGEPKGFIDSTGSFVRAGREDIQNVVSKQRARTAPIEGGVTTEQFQQQQNLQRSIGQIGQIGELNEVTEAPINWAQAFTAGGIGVLPGAASGAIGFVGGPITGGITTAAGAVGGFIAGTVANIKEQQRGELGAANEELTLATFSMRQYAMQASRDPANADYWLSQFDNAKTRAFQARRQTQAEVQGVLNSFMEDGREDLAKFDTFLRPGGKADVYKDKLTVALNSGVPLTESGEDLIFAENFK